MENSFFETTGLMIEEEDEPPPLLNNNTNIIKNLSHLSVIKPFIHSSKGTLNFIQQHYPNLTLSEWSTWQWQIRNSITRFEELSKFIDLSNDELAFFQNNEHSFPFRVTPYYLSLIDKYDSQDPIRRSVIPVASEFIKSPEEIEDPLCEIENTPVEGIIHKYPDRVLLFATGFCSTYCRYCTRNRVVGSKSDFFNLKAIEYIKEHNEIRDVLISGGDPLTFDDEKLDILLSMIRKIKHVEIIRIGTKMPSVLPYRITNRLIKVLKKYHPLYISIHFIHPNEITIETKEACCKLADAGIPLGSQTVLLKGINDDAQTMTTLCHELLKIRVKPYYIYQCDPVIGSGHFRTSVQSGVEIIKQMRGFTTGYAIPQFIVDGVGKGGKIPLSPDYYLGRDGDYIILKNYKDQIIKYPDFIK